MSIISQFQKQIKTGMLQKHHFKFHTKKKESKKMQLLHPLEWVQLKSIVDINKYLLTFYWGEMNMFPSLISCNLI